MLYLYVLSLLQDSEESLKQKLTPQENDSDLYLIKLKVLAVHQTVWQCWNQQLTVTMIKLLIW